MKGSVAGIAQAVHRSVACRTISEKRFQAQIVALARLTGWWVQHQYDSRRSEPGWPDLVLIRPPRLLFREVKTDAGKLTSAQQRVLSALAACGMDVGTWRPSLWPEIEATLLDPAPGGAGRE